MASHLSFTNMATLALVFVLCVPSALGKLFPTGAIRCKDLKKDSCAFAVSSSGTRCVLEKMHRPDVYLCRSSEIETNNLKDIVETDQCISACGLNRNTVGISTDSLTETEFTQKLCSPQCYGSCPNIVDLYSNLAAGEGVLLPDFCKAQKKNDRRELAEIRSSGIVAPGPMPRKLVMAPIMAPAMAPY